MKIIYKEIAELTGKTEAGIKSMKKNNPEQLELLKMGALCKKYNITTKELENIVNLRTTQENLNETL
ncbi:MAG: hypothetical protein PHG81_12865 [Aliarcobacter sp.]|nr:hypothetical protein [Aliarcobacter sp.]